MSDIDAIEPHLNGLEPSEYFEDLKSKLQPAEMEKLQSQIAALDNEIVRVKMLGQTRVLHNLSFSYQTIVKEQVLLTKGIDTFVYKDDIERFIDSVIPKNSVKIIELSRYPRIIPEGPGEKIKAAADLGIFDDICVVFTDLTSAKYETKADRDFVRRNQDPIAFGYFKNDNLNVKHERMYFIADWIDEFCDLTFTKMIEKLGELGVSKPAKKIGHDSEYVNRIVSEAMDEVSAAGEERRRVTPLTLPAASKKGFFTKIFDAFARG